MRLYDSLPASRVEAWQKERSIILQRAESSSRDHTEDEANRLEELRQDIDRWLDKSTGSCLFHQPEIAEQMSQALLHFHSTRYLLHAWCVMPNHVHILAEPILPWSLQSIVKSWSAYTTRQINALLNRKGRVWQQDSYDHLIRSNDEYRNTVDYIYHNPENAGLNKDHWPWRWKPEISS